MSTKHWRFPVVVRTGLFLFLTPIVLVCSIADNRVIAIQETIQLFEPIEDAYVSQLNSNSNYGRDEVISVRSYKTATESLNHRIYLKFDMTGLGHGVHVASAKLRLYKYIEGNHPGVRKIEVKRVLDLWREINITWCNRPVLAETTTNLTDVDGAGYWYQWDVTADVQSWIDERVQNNGFCLLDSEEDSTVDYASVFFSREAAEMYMYRPRLEVKFEAVIPGFDPFPVTLSIIGGAVLIVTLVMFVKRKKICLV